MTLRHRLLLVYLIVVLLSGAVVGAAVFEIQHAHRIMRELQAWNSLVLNVEKLKSRWPPPPDVPLDYYDLKDELARQFLFVAPAAEEETYPPRAVLPRELADRVRQVLNETYRAYDQWCNLAPEVRPEVTGMVKTPLDGLSRLLENELWKLNVQADTQANRSRILLVVVAFLTLFHVLTIGSLLRRWLLWPMERLNAQVEALARDEAPPEPLLTSPREMATLAGALDRARQSLSALRQQLLDSERLTIIGQMAAQLAHNLRNPLASIRAAAQVTARQHDDPASLQRRMGDIVASVDRLNRWVMGLMEVARRDPTQTRKVDVVPTVFRAVEAVSSELVPKELKLEVDTPGDGIVCTHDPSTLEHALVAMLVNAIEASPLCGCLHVRVEVAGGPQDATCRISVIDQGAGVPADEPDRIFSFSYSTKQKGVGLGLALARQALTRQGGSTHAFNNPDRGATVYVELPIHCRPDSAGPAAPAAPDMVSSAAARD